MRHASTARAALACTACAASLALAACGSGSGGSRTPQSSADAPATGAAAVSTQTATVPAPTYKPPKQVVAVGREFIRTAVLRTDLARAWDLVTPRLREHLTKQQWLTGNIPVVPFPKKDFLAARYRVVLASPTEVVFEVLMLPRAHSLLMPTRFYLHVVRSGSRWLVDYWVPRGEGGGLPGL